MKTYFCATVLALICIQSTNSYSALGSDWDARTSAYPYVANMSRAELDSKLCNDEKLEYKVEVIIEKDMLLDDSREHWLKLDIQHKYVERSTYEYYEISKIELVSSKPDKTKSSEEILRSVKSRAFEVSCDINKSPLVIYLPYGYSINYRIWTTSRKNKISSPGMMLESPRNPSSQR